MQRTATLLVIALAPLLAGVATAHQDDDFDIPGVSAEADPPEYGLEEMVAEIRTVHGDARADEIADRCGPNGDVGLHELEEPVDVEGAHDSGNILINTRSEESERARQSLFEAAMVLAHEFEHLTRCGPNDESDPTTKGRCGECEHARMHLDQGKDIMDMRACGEFDFTNPADVQKWIDICSAAHNDLIVGRYWLSRCGRHRQPDCPAYDDDLVGKYDTLEDLFESCCFF